MDVGRLAAFRPVDHLELDALALAQGPVAFLLNGGVVHENIDAVADIDEPVALSRVEPLHLTFRHFEVSFRPVPVSYQVVACLSIHRAKDFSNVVYYRRDGNFASPADDPYALAEVDGARPLRRRLRLDGDRMVADAPPPGPAARGTAAFRDQH